MWCKGAETVAARIANIMVTRKGRHDKPCMYWPHVRAWRVTKAPLGLIRSDADCTSAEGLVAECETVCAWRGGSVEILACDALALLLMAEDDDDGSIN